MEQLVDNKKLMNICKICKIDDVIEGLQQGLETLIDEKNTNISGGQKQRIVIARALYKNSSVIILDEPTSALDKESLQVLKKVLYSLKKDKIIILISHDKEILQICDDIINIDIIQEKNKKDLFLYG